VTYIFLLIVAFFFTLSFLGLGFKVSIGLLEILASPTYYKLIYFECLIFASGSKKLARNYINIDTTSKGIKRILLNLLGTVITFIDIGIMIRLLKRLNTSWPNLELDTGYFLSMISSYFQFFPSKNKKTMPVKKIYQ